MNPLKLIVGMQCKRLFDIIDIQIDDTIPPVLTKSMEQFNELLKASTAPEDMALQKLAQFSGGD